MKDEIINLTTIGSAVIKDRDPIAVSKERSRRNQESSSYYKACKAASMIVIIGTISIVVAKSLWTLR